MRYAALSAGLILGVSALPGAMAETGDASTIAARAGKVSFRLPLWTEGHLEVRTTTVHVRYPSDEPPAQWDRQPVKLQVLIAGEWKTVGQAKQKPEPGNAASRTRVRYVIPIDGTVAKIRARAYRKDNSWIDSKVRSVTVTLDGAEYAPTALPRTGGYCWDPVVGRNRASLAYGCPDIADEYSYNTWLYNAKADKRKRLDSYTDYPDLATGAHVAIGHRLVYYDEDLDTYRARLYDLDMGKSHWIAHKRNGKRAYEARHASVSANGKRIAYASRTRGIAPRAPRKGSHVYAVGADKKRSRYLGNGSHTEISASGRYLVWRNPLGKIKRYDLRENRLISITKRKGGKRSAPDVSAGGRYVTYSEGRNGSRVVRFYDRREGRSRTIARGRAPVLSDNGRYVAYRGADGLELYVWDRKADTSELITVGPSGDGSGARVSVPDISPNGRWIVGATKSATVAPDNGRRHAKDWIVLFDRHASG